MFEEKSIFVRVSMIFTSIYIYIYMSLIYIYTHLYTHLYTNGVIPRGTIIDDKVTMCTTISDNIGQHTCPDRKFIFLRDCDTGLSFDLIYANKQSYRPNICSLSYTNHCTYVLFTGGGSYSSRFSFGQNHDRRLVGKTL